MGLIIIAIPFFGVLLNFQMPRANSQIGALAPQSTGTIKPLLAAATALHTDIELQG